MKQKMSCWVVLGLSFCCGLAYAQENDNEVDPTANITEQRVAISSTVSSWINFSHSEAESNRPGFEYDGDIESTSLGLEWSHQRWAVGATLTHADASFETPGSDDERDERKTAFTPYVTWKIHPGIHLRAFAGMSEGEFSRSRSVVNFDNTFTGTTDTEGTTLGLSALLFAPIGPGLLSGTLSVVKDRTKFDEFVEQASDPSSFMPISNPTFRQRVTTVSAQARYFVNFGNFTPYVSLGWFEHTAGNLNEPDPSGWTWGGGVAYRLTSRARLALQYSQLEDKKFEDNKTFSGQFIFTF